MQNELNAKNKFSANQLKVFAIIAMAIDHFTDSFFPGYPKTWWIILLHIIGRLAAPTMWFMIVEGYHHTRDLKKYITRLFIFSFISHFAYNFCFGIPFVPFKTTVFNQTSVIWTLVWGVVALCVTDQTKVQLKKWQQTLLVLIICLVTFPADWSCIGVLCILAINKNRYNLKLQTKEMMIYIFFYAIVWWFFIDKVYAVVQLFVIIVVPFIKNYNGTRGKCKAMKWFFYAFYIGHLVICGIIRIALHGNVATIIGG